MDETIRLILIIKHIKHIPIKSTGLGNYFSHQISATQFETCGYRTYDEPHDDLPD